MAQSLVDKVKGILYRNGMGGTTLTGGKVEPIIINPPDKQRREGFENAKASNLVEKLLRKGRSSKGCSRCGSTCTCTKEERSQAQGSGLSEQEGSSALSLRTKAAEHGHGRLTPHQEASRQRSRVGKTKNTPAVSTSGSPPNSDSVYEQRYVIPAQRPNLEQKVKVILGLDKNLESKDINKQLPRRRGLKLTQEEINAGSHPMVAGTKLVKKRVGEGVGFTEPPGTSSEKSQGDNFYSGAPTPKFKPDPKKKKAIPEEAGENDQPKGRLYLHLDVARRYALKFGGVVARDEGTGKYFVKAKGKYSIEQVEDETLGKKVLTILESIRFRTAIPVPFVSGRHRPLRYTRRPRRATNPVVTTTEEVGFGSSPVPAFMQKR